MQRDGAQVGIQPLLVDHHCRRHLRNERQDACFREARKDGRGRKDGDRRETIAEKRP
jgi:hypothetical protein